VYIQLSRLVNIKWGIETRNLGTLYGESLSQPPEGSNRFQFRETDCVVQSSGVPIETFLADASANLD
jgi:hypothetical protein